MAKLLHFDKKMKRVSFVLLSFIRNFASTFNETIIKLQRVMNYTELGKTGMKISQLSFGASSLGSVFHDTKLGESIQAVEAAIEGGINFIDVSPYYGYYKAEQVLGQALKGIPRQKYFLSTKVGRYGQDGRNTWDYSAERVTRSVYESMERLGIDHIDLINVHDIEFQSHMEGGLQKIVDETLPAL